ncbi:hypothetical protein H112_03688 [Trichophyton rubrum D6]|uniref:Uncharacterized protein n=2 Tax=Trichophyton TaxID=5550 RepID=A0A022W5J0_TRIRU|nr:hypothetical protein H100_03696 [Trichophyton rubrum MR850]EZF42715.1 hypothetical protein H102_03687 [Trichophyton rubrum CBS 100081]EZF53363.1 hypothetical protein H103_03700 [Trichophyton rubrum CBS 288.86]EZF63970.1 hypothetical protein H104_03684 [Trichophyton rubrum CBS 289.86]EZF85329.1 hypothetical protein H110_03697 [Trichophyton rubrum MR1448]EZF96018.1 hypothetical protein H113_03720 [Trichophyton rubrum MR1459]EZG07118.1 hypothetical protein H106_03509 [Trichophyton rubrum CBS 
MLHVGVSEASWLPCFRRKRPAFKLAQHPFSRHGEERRPSLFLFFEPLEVLIGCSNIIYDVTRGMVVGC